MQQSQSKQSDNPSTIEINDPTTEISPQNEPSHSRGGKKIYALILTLIIQNNTDIDVSKILFLLLPCAILILHIHSAFYFSAHILFLFWEQNNINTQNQLQQKYSNKQCIITPKSR